MRRWSQIVILLVAVTCGHADVLDDWNNALLDSIRTENTHPCVASRALGIVHGAMYDTSAAILQTEHFFRIERVPAGLPLVPALNGAAYCTATNLFPSRAGSFKELYQHWLRAAPESDHAAEALRLGRSIADAWINWRANDASSGNLPYIPRTEAGAWRRTPPFMRPPEMMNWARVVPFTMVSAAQFRPPGPPELSSARYMEDFTSVQRLGSQKSSSRTPEQTEIAFFWSDFSYTVTPPGHWNHIAQVVALERAMTLPDKVRLFAALNLTLSDVGVACWDSKYVYNFWRPVTAIRAAETDGNSGTEADSKWTSLLNTPAFPEYVSGHSAFSGAAAVILADFNGGDKISFDVESDSLPGKVRRYESLWTCAEEVSQSRLYGGIHFPSALRDGLTLGQRIARQALDHFFGSQPRRREAELVRGEGELSFQPWLGVAARPGTSIMVEKRTLQGDWEVWTNLVAIAPVSRWRVAPLQNASDFRLRRQ